MRAWSGVGLAIVALLLGRSLKPILGKIFRLRDEQRCGTLEVLVSKTDAKFEIIAVPGLGAHPDHTWETRATQEANAAESQTVQSPTKVHLLKDLLADEFPEARILNFAHESNWLLDAPVKTTEEIGRSLLREIKKQRSSKCLPIIFIGHSLGGIIIKQALCQDDSKDIINDTSGIIFLGTPHQGSSVSNAGTALAWVTGFLGSDTTLVRSLNTHNTNLSNLSQRFEDCKAPGQDGVQKFRVRSFYETKPTYLLGLSLGIVVSRDSAVAHADKSFAMDTNHTKLNKCGGPADKLLIALVEQIAELKAKSPVERADEWILKHHYTPQRLRIERLSGERLEMKECYINLAIVEQAGQEKSHSKTEGDSGSSPFSLLTRQKVEVLDKTKQVDLDAIFKERQGNNGQLIEPRRILIRGHAGVGKTTLCKKIVYGFINGELGNWNKLFDRVLWVPLRNLKLKERRAPTYTLEDLICHEFFGTAENKDLARALSNAFQANKSKTLFLLDGLDEVSQDLKTQDLTTQDLESQNGMSQFLKMLLEQPNIIITSRPSARPPSGLDLELETIGFEPDQVDRYIEQSFTDEGKKDVLKVNGIQNFLQERWLIQSLVRIPIQLDALCYTWQGVTPDTELNTMTCIYMEIELKLWRKDILRQPKRYNAKALTEEALARAASGLHIRPFRTDVHA
ncbi:hypothetical protein NQ176_g9220 [Zarea fungicola]|uniref:Uncharacterized protein n=1 Tax=Zarea fungicola TaxID=93591 RepID=A0ACC1MMW7_9HYPO|nr:hypothetical protein NQ176_g9220 [Lecanicillium fungicola]